MSPGPAVLLGNIGKRIELRGSNCPIRRFDANHLVVATLPLAIDAIGQSEHFEHVFFNLAS
ncbi:unannotated protein [freshwater metagenome]|uniref:Unannotated protein n=1 Tax=freshwater metagenome TaxID=449393 RepID=A0A6J7N2I0_9ZZZZ